MEQKILNTYYEEYESASDLNADDKKLLDEAVKAASSAYAPYSHFNVGAAVLLDNGEIVCGSNQENAAYPSGLCAERVALFYSGAQYPHVKVHTIAVVAFTQNATPAHSISPCGDCRQVMAEYEHRHQKNIRLIMVGDAGRIYIFNSVKALLPFMFNSNSLKA